jgi:hypothetical protein
MIWWRSRGFSSVTFALSWSPTSEGGAAESDFTLQLAVEGVGALHCLRALKHVAAGVSAPRAHVIGCKEPMADGVPVPQVRFMAHSIRSWFDFLRCYQEFGK